MDLVMRRRVIGTLVLLTLSSSSLVLAMAARHIAWDAMIMGKDGSKIRGIAEMVAGKSAGTTAVTVSYKSDTPGVTRPWHVHVGSCAKAGPILGGAAAYPPLKVGAAGTAEGKATLRLAVPDSGEFYVSIHDSPTNMSKVVACGDMLLGD